MSATRQPQAASAHRAASGYANFDEPIMRCHAQTEPPPSSQDLTIELFTEDDLPIPDAAFTVRFQNGETRSGRTGPDGVRMMTGVPENTVFEIEYMDPGDVRDKALAAHLNAGLAEASYDMIIGVLRESATDLQGIQTAYENHFGDDMVADCRSAFGPEEGRDEIDFLLAKAGLFGGLIVNEFNDGR